MIFSRLFGRKKYQVEDEYVEQESRYVALEDTGDTKLQVVDLCEQLIETAKDYEDAREEYELVTSYLNDIQIIEDLPEESKSEIISVATNVAKLNKARDEFLQTEQKLSDAQFAQMQEIENEIPNKIIRLKENEIDLEKVNKDLNYLEGEKMRWKIDKEDCIQQQKQLRNIAVILLVFFTLSAVLLLLTSLMTDINTQLMMIIIAFVAVLIGTYVFLKYQECNHEIRQSEVNWNHAVTLENRVKIRYVNIKNAVDYTCEKFHVRNARELNENYEKYFEMVREREKFKRTNSDLDRYNNSLVNLLSAHNLYDSRVWINYSNALINPKDMVELKHDLLTRRQKLRNRMEYSVDRMTEFRRDILLHKNELGDEVEKVNSILKKIAQINTNI